MPKPSRPAAPVRARSIASRLIPGVPFTAPAALRFANQGQFHPLKYLAGLARAIVRLGGRIHCGSHVAEFEKRPRRPQVKTSGQAHRHRRRRRVRDELTRERLGHDAHEAGGVSHVRDRRAHSAQRRPSRACTGTRSDPVLTTCGSRKRQDGEPLLIVGGEDHKTGQADDQERRFGALLEWTRQHFPMAGDIAYRWSGQVIEPNDYMAFIGRNPGDENVYIATGDSGNGMTHGTIAGMLIPDLILGVENRWTKLYDPARVTLRAAAEFVRENVNVAAKYADWITPGEVSSPDDDQAGHRRDHARRREEVRRLPRRRWNAPHPLGGVHAPLLHRGLELARENVGLSVPRLALRPVRQGGQRTCRKRPCRTGQRDKIALGGGLGLAALVARGGRGTLSGIGRC